MSIVEEIDCQDADDFLRQLSPTGPVFGGTEAVGSNSHLGDAWVFRGHADNDYRLAPSAFRGINAFSRFGGQPCIDNDSQIRAETGVLRRFFNLADANGLSLPEDSQVLRETIQRLFTEAYFEDLGSGKQHWPPRTLWSLLGIAQHYGVPTRLLDWTRKAKVASYFAASGAAKRLSAAKDEAEREELAEKCLCVWAFALDRYSSYFDPDAAAFFSEATPTDAPVVKVTAPRAHNPNLHAQDGLFSLVIQNLTGRLEHDVERGSLEDTIEFSLQDRREYGRGLFYRFRLRWHHAKHLMWRLMQEGIGQATIYPGYGGVVGALQEESEY